MSFYIKVYDRHHTELDEIHEIGDIQYSPSLNNYGTFTFSIPLNCKKFTDENFSEENHIELYEDNDSNCIWWGVISDIEFDEPVCNIGCYGYLYLLEKIIFERKEYKPMKCSALIMRMLKDCNDKYPTGILEGETFGDSVTTERIVDDGDKLLDKIIEYINEYNYSIRIDKDRKLNFYSILGEDKTYLELTYDSDSSEFSNIVQKPQVTRISSEMANCITCISGYTEETATYTDTSTFVESGEKTITSIMYDEDSIKKYGLKQDYIKFTDIKLQKTLDERCKAELEKRSTPAININLDIVDSGVCPISELNVGDLITLKIKPYRFDRSIRILEIKRDVKKDTYALTVGNIILGINKPKIKIYKK